VKLEILEEARTQYREASAWWHEHRDAKSLLAQEFLAAIRTLQTVPETGQVYVQMRGRTIRRWLMPKTKYHIYYRFDRDQDLLVIYSVWSAVRGRGPRL
jgi:plasmid stabilization system protein ParE